MSKLRQVWRTWLIVLGMGLLGSCLLYVSVTMIVGSLTDMVTVLSLDEDAIILEAVVDRLEMTRLDNPRSSTVRTMTTPVLAFIYQDRRYEFTPSTRGDEIFEVGQPLSVTFPPGQPEAAVLTRSPNQDWMVGLLIGLMMLAGPILILYGLQSVVKGDF